MNWRKLHFNTNVVDLHNHAPLKQSLLFRGLGRKKERWLASLFKRGFWPFSSRSTFQRMADGGMSIIMSTNYVPEKEWLNDQPLVGWALKLSPRTRRHLFHPTYFQSTINMMDEMESEIKKWNAGGRRKNERQKYDTASLLSPEREAVLVTNSAELEEALALPKRPMIFIHSIEGSHSLQGEVCGKEVEGGDEAQVRKEVLENLDIFSKKRGSIHNLSAFLPKQVRLSGVSLSRIWHQEI